MAKKGRDYWFKKRDQGWAWGLPANFKGWISFGIFLAIWLGSLAWYTGSLDGESVPIYKSVIFAGVILIDIIGLFYVSSKHGELSIALPKKHRFIKKITKV